MNTEKPIEKRDERFRKAAENLERITERIAPFVKHAPFKSYSTSGKWRSDSEIIWP